MKHFKLADLSIKPIMLIRLLLGYFNNLYPHKTFKILGKAYAVFLNVVIAVVHLYFDVNIYRAGVNEGVLAILNDCILILENALHLLMSIFYEDQDFYNYCVKINNIDGNINFSALDITCSNAYILLILFLLTNCVCLFVWISKISLTGIDVVLIFDVVNTISFCFRHIIIIIIFELFRSRLKKIRINLKKHFNTQGVANDDLIKQTMKIYLNLNKNIQQAINPHRNFVYVSYTKCALFY